MCEREDIHLCNAPGMDKSYCLQVSVRLPKVRMDSGAPAAVTSILCTGYNKYRMDSAEESKTNDETIFIYTNLWASDSSGQLSIWIVPTEEIDYVPVHTVKAHKGSINDMKNTLYNVITIGDDGFVLIFDAVKFAKVRTINIMEWCNYRSIIEKPNLPRKIKSLNIHEDYVNGGSLAVGTSYGDIIVFSIGTTV